MTARKLPASLAFLAFVEEQRRSLPASDWAAKFGRVHTRITAQVLPDFSDAVIADARQQMESERLSLPPDARPRARTPLPADPRATYGARRHDRSTKRAPPATHQLYSANQLQRGRR